MLFNKEKKQMRDVAAQDRKNDFAMLDYMNSSGFIELDDTLEYITAANKKAREYLKDPRLVGKRMANYIALGQDHPHPTGHEKHNSTLSLTMMETVVPTQGFVWAVCPDETRLELFIFGRKRYTKPTGRTVWGAMFALAEDVRPIRAENKDAQDAD